MEVRVGKGAGLERRWRRGRRRKPGRKYPIGLKRIFLEFRFKNMARENGNDVRLSDRIDNKVENIGFLGSVMRRCREIIIERVTDRIASTRVSCIEKSTVIGKFYKTVVRPTTMMYGPKSNEEEKISNESCANAKMDLMWRDSIEKN